MTRGKGKGKGEELKKTHNNSTNKKNSRIKASEEHFLLTLPIPSIVHEQPENTTESISEPTRKQRTNQPQKIIKHRNRLRNNPRHNPHPRHNKHPDANTHETVRPHTLRRVEIIPEYPHVDVFSGDVAVYDSGDHDGGDGDAVGDFLEERGGGAEGGGGDGGAGVGVGEDGDEEVHGYVDALEEEERFGVFFRFLELGYEGEEGDVAWMGGLVLESSVHGFKGFRSLRTCICEDDVGDSFECFVKARLHGYIYLPISRFFNPNTSHCDDHSRNDRYKTDDSHIADLLQSSRQRADQADEEAYEAE